MFVDSHAHLYLNQFDEDNDTVINEAIKKKVKKIFLPNIDSSTTPRMNELVKRYPEVCFPMMGLHPCSVKEDYKTELKHVEEELKNGSYCGIGETGIDLYWDKTFRKEQIEAFEIQIGWALDMDLPIIIHSRESLDLTIEIISNHQNGKLKGIFHCFNGTPEQSQKIVDLNFHMGLGGVITFKKANLDEMISLMPLENMVLETDSPYLAPVPYRGKRNESSYIPLIAEKISEVKNLSVDEIAKTTTHNAELLFGLTSN